MSTFDLTCLGCGGTVDCPDIPDSKLYSLENPTFPFVIDCPDNNCQIGPIIYFSCCDRLLQAPVPVGSSSGQIQSILNSLAAQCFNLQSACGELPPFPPGGFTPSHPITLFFNQSQTCKLICPDGNPFTYTVPAGWVAAITQNKANATAYSLACAKAKASRFCLSDIKTSPACGVPYSVTITASGPIVTPCTWTVITGALPAGLTLGGFSPNIDTTLGPVETIQGTPTTGGPFSFTLRCEGSDGVFMQKDYSLTVLGTCNSCPNCLSISNFSAIFTDQFCECIVVNPAFPKWDGTMPRVRTDCSDPPNPGSNPIYAITEGALNFPGAGNCVVQMGEIQRSPGPIWVLTVGDAGLWHGSKNGGGPAGVYTKNAGCVAAATLNVIAVTCDSCGTNQPIIHSADAMDYYALCGGAPIDQFLTGVPAGPPFNDWISPAGSTPILLTAGINANVGVQVLQIVLLDQHNLNVQYSKATIDGCIIGTYNNPVIVPNGPDPNPPLPTPPATLHVTL